MSFTARLSKLENLIRSLNARLATVAGSTGTHATSHSPGGSDTLSGYYATTAQNLDHDVRHSPGGADTLDIYYATTADFLNHKVRHSPAGADSLSTFYETTVVTRLQGRDVNSAAPTNNQFLSWDAGNSYWKPSAAAAGGSGSAVLFYESSNRAANTFSTTSTTYVDHTGAQITFTPTSGAKQFITFQHTWENNSLGAQDFFAFTDGSNSVKVEEDCIASRADTRSSGFMQGLFQGLPAAATTLKVRMKVGTNSGLTRGWQLNLVEST